MLIHFRPFKLFATLWTVALKAPLSMDFSRQEYWSGFPCPPPGDLPSPGIKPTFPVSPTFQADYQGSPKIYVHTYMYVYI